MVHMENLTMHIFFRYVCIFGPLTPKCICSHSCTKHEIKSLISLYSLKKHCTICSFFIPCSFSLRIHNMCHCYCFFCWCFFSWCVFFLICIFFWKKTSIKKKNIKDIERKEKMTETYVKCLHIKQHVFLNLSWMRSHFLFASDEDRFR